MPKNKKSKSTAMPQQQESETLEGPQGVKKEEDEVKIEEDAEAKLNDEAKVEAEEESAKASDEVIEEEASKASDEAIEEGDGESEEREEPKALEQEIEREEEGKFEEEEEPIAADVTVPDINPINRRKMKRKPISQAQRAFAQLKLDLVAENFNPIPFSPIKTLDFSIHEDLFRALNLWEFVNLDLSLDIRSDLLISLIANYDPSKHRSFVQNVEISVSKLDLAAALKLPVEKEKGGIHKDLFFKDESKDIVEEFLTNYVLLEDEDDMCILPQEVVAATQMVKEGKADEVDWAELIWVLVEKEILGVQKSGSCHFASHIHCLMKCQQPELFEKESGAEAEAPSVPEPESSIEVSDSMDDEDTDDDCERQGVGLSLRMGENENLMDGIEDSERGAELNWVNEEDKDEGFEHCLRRCNTNEVRSMEFENLCKGEQVEREDEFSNLERLTSTDLIHSMEGARASYSPRMNSLHQHTGEFLTTGVDGNASTSLFIENDGKRHIDNVDIHEDDDIGRFHQNNQHKRMRSGGLWEEHTPSGFDSYMEQIHHTMGKAKMLFAEKEQACLDAHLQLQYLNEMLKEKDHIIQTLENTQIEENQRWEHNVHRYEHELNILANLVVGYKKALKETQKNFEEYRKKCPEGDEPLYRDVPGSGGLVLTSRELERLQLENEEEMRRVAEEAINAFQCGWLLKFQDYTEMVMILNQRLVELDEEVKLIKEKFLKSKDKGSMSSD